MRGKEVCSLRPRARTGSHLLDEETTFDEVSIFDEVSTFDEVSKLQRERGMSTPDSSHFGRRAFQSSHSASRFQRVSDMPIDR